MMNFFVLLEVSISCIFNIIYTIYIYIYIKSIRTFIYVILMFALEISVSRIFKYTSTCVSNIINDGFEIEEIVLNIRICNVH